MSDLMGTIERLREARELEELRAEVAMLRREVARLTPRGLAELLAMQSIPSEAARRASTQFYPRSIVGFPPPSLWDAMFGGG